MVSRLSDFLLQDQRQYIIDKVKAPIVKALITLANRIQVEPTKLNTVHPNTHVLIDVWDKFLEMEDNGGRKAMFKAIRKIWIAEHEHDPYYRDRMNVIFEMLIEAVLEGRWKPRPLDHPSYCWKIDPNMRGEGYQLMRDRYYQRKIARV
jgi:hypothetical protein